LPLQRAPIRFGPFCLHPTQGLARNGQEIRITPKSQAVLHALAERPGEIVTKDELLRAVWPSTLVTDAALSSCISELRRALQDDARKPRYIETVHRRGFRLLASCTQEMADAAAQVAAAPLFGRGAAFAELVRLQDRVRKGSSELVCVTGAAGVGKTALVEKFLAGIAQRDAWPIARVACVEGAGAAYRPLLEALTQLCRRSVAAEVVPVLRRCAPTWLAELWEIETSAELSILRQRTCGATSKQLWRELEAALAAMTRDAPMVVCIDDVQWADPATLAWIASFARRPARATVLLIAISRNKSPPAPSTLRELSETTNCTVVELQRLDRTAVVDYLRSHLPAETAASCSFEQLAEFVYRNCRGEPLLLADVANRLADGAPLSHRDGRWASGRGAVSRPLDPPVNIEDMMQRQFERLAAEQLQTLEAASVAGKSFTSAEVAAACGSTAADVEDTFARLEAFVVRGPQVRWPDGTTTATFRFLHALHRSALLESLSPLLRAVFHERIGRRLETAYGDRAAEIACDLAMHFERTSDLSRAVIYLHHAGDTARRRSAPAIAAQHYRRALVLLASQPASAERNLSEARLQIALGRELIAMQGPGADEVATCYERAQALQPSIESAAERCAILWGLWVFYLNRGPLEIAKEVADRHFDLTRQLGDPALLLDSHHAQWGTALMIGDVSAILAHTRHGMALCGSRADHSLAMTSGCTLYDVHLNNHHAAVCAGFFSAWGDTLAGRQEIAARSLDAAITHARDVGHPFTLALALVFSAAVVATGDAAATCRRYASEGRALAADHGFDILQNFGAIYEGWASVRLGDTAAGLALIQAALAAHRDSGLSLLRPFQLALAADAQLRSRRLDETAQSLEEAFAIVHRVGDRLALAELHRIKGELHLAISTDRDSREQARDEFRSAVEVASAQGATLLAARALQALERLPGGTQKVSPMILKTAR